MDKNTLVKVLNRDNGAVVYSLPELNGLVRVYQSGEIKEVSFKELQQLSYVPGGKELLEESLVILENDQAIKELLGQVEPEYSYTQKDVKRLLTEGSLDEFLDCLDFAPEGVKDLIKTLAVDLPLNDVKKRQAIQQKLGFNIDSAIRIKKESESDFENQNRLKPERRVKNTQSGTKTPLVRRVVSTK